VIDTHARGSHGLAAAADEGTFRKTMVRSLHMIKEQVQTTALPPRN
jgi:hypothetical protein